MDVFRSGLSGAFNGGGIEHLLQQQQQQQQQLTSATTTGTTVAGTAPSRMVGSGNVSAHTTVHVTTSTEVDPFDEKRIDEIRRTLRMLEDIGHGRHIINWTELVDPSQPVESAKKISAALARPTTVPGAISSVAECITTPAHLSIVALLDPPFLAKVRDAVLQDLLNALTMVHESNPMPVCSEMLVEMVKLNLVVLRGVASTLEALLSDPNSRRAAIAALGKLADQKRGNEVFLGAMQNLEPLVRMIDEPEYEYDCLAISRLLGWGGAHKTASLVPVKRMDHSSPVTAMTYFRQRDELASATFDGTVTIWGTPHPSTGDVKAAVALDLPQYCVPVAMDGPPRGNYLLIAGMPFPAVNVQTMELERGSINSNVMNNSFNSSGKKRSSFATVPRGPIVRLLTCNESTGAWTSGETITRKETVTLTTAAALASFVVCTAESGPSDKLSESGLQHDLVLLNGHTSQFLRRFERVHDDYTTIIRAAEDGDRILFTGSRDSVVKVWDIRSSNNRAGLTTAATMSALATPLHRLKGNHTDTITAILPHRKALLTASLDGSFLVWDARRMTAPMHEVRLKDPILDLALADSGYVVISTARGLKLFSLESLKAHDIIPNVAYTQLKANNDGSIIFAAGNSGVSIYALHR
ncbi:F-box and WD40 domain containing protein [Trypanosoma cruzi]|uniref:F-box and WD40 domain containing protein n=1 Tax=Trypanosoma cruzi TaxID=5693 RepID=A0A2V2VM52_TRYCR|nr:F-box and WD40 domain containing protein [Trypanosoma cruzi]RNC49623.1 G-protein (beta)-like protein [Trypanosoma cruzi]